MAGYTRGELAKKIDTKGETINLWTIMGLIYPNVSGVQSHRRIYDQHNLIECYFIVFLQKEGLSLEKIKRILDGIREYNILAKKEGLQNFYDDPDLDGYYKIFKFRSVDEWATSRTIPSSLPIPTPLLLSSMLYGPKAITISQTEPTINGIGADHLEGFHPDPEKKGVFSKADYELLSGCFYFEFINLGEIKRKIFKNRSL